MFVKIFRDTYMKYRNPNLQFLKSILTYHIAVRFQESLLSAQLELLPDISITTCLLHEACFTGYANG